jgi:hypothetical protein
VLGGQRLELATQLACAAELEVELDPRSSASERSSASRSASPLAGP